MQKYHKKSKSFILKYCLNCTYDVFLSCPYKGGGDCGRMGGYTSLGVSQDEIDELIEWGIYTKEEVDRHLEKYFVKTENNIYLSTIEMKDKAK